MWKNAHVKIFHLFRTPDEFEFPSSARQARTSVPAFFFPPISAKGGSGGGVQSKVSATLKVQIPPETDET